MKKLFQFSRFRPSRIFCVVRAMSLRPRLYKHKVFRFNLSVRKSVLQVYPPCDVINQSQSFIFQIYTQLDLLCSQGCVIQTNIIKTRFFVLIFLFVKVYYRCTPLVTSSTNQSPLFSRFRPSWIFCDVRAVSVRPRPAVQL